MYQAYYDADPENRTPPIPTAFVKAPVNKATQQVMCHSDVIPSLQLVDDIMLNMFAGMLDLEQRIAAAPYGDRVNSVSGGKGYNVAGTCAMSIDQLPAS